MCKLALFFLFLIHQLELSAEDVTHTYAIRSGLPLQLDIHYPNEAGTESFPVLLWFHGGGWRNGSRENWKLIRWLTGEGYAVVSADYRLTGKAPFPAQQQDCRDTLRWISKHGRNHRLNPNHVVVAGLSAGAHLASLTGLNSHQDDSMVLGILHFYGPSDFTSMMRYAKKDSAPLNKKDSNVYQLLGGPLKERASLAKEASPVTYLDSADPPLLILVGTKDSLMTQRQCRFLHEKAVATGVESQLAIIEGAGHGGPEFSDPKRKEIILQFLRSLSPRRAD